MRPENAQLLSMQPKPQLHAEAPLNHDYVLDKSAPICRPNQNSLLSDAFS